MLSKTNCFCRSIKYQRLQGEARARYQEERKAAKVSYKTFTTVTNTVSNARTAAIAQKHKNKPHRPKKARPRTESSETPKFQMKSKPNNTNPHL